MLHSPSVALLVSVYNALWGYIPFFICVLVGVLSPRPRLLCNVLDELNLGYLDIKIT